MRIYLSSRDWDLAQAVETATGRDVHQCLDADGDATWVDAADEIAGAVLLAEVRTAIQRARGEL